MKLREGGFIETLMRFCNGNELLRDVGEQYSQTLFSRATNHDKKSIYKPTLNQPLLNINM